MSFSKSISAKGNSHPAKTANMSRSCLIYLVSAILLIPHNLEAARRPRPGANYPGVANQLAKAPIGSKVKVEMANGRKLEGELVTKTETDFGLLEPGHPAAQDIKSSDVRSIKPIRPPRTWVTVAMFAGFAGLMALAGAEAGTIW